MIKLIVNNSVEYDESKIFSVKTRSGILGNDGASVGNVIAGEIDAVIRVSNVDEIGRNANVVLLSSIEEGTAISLVTRGSYTIDTRDFDKDTKKLSIHGFDNILFLEQPFCTEGIQDSFPMKDTEAVDKICSAIGCPINPSSLSLMNCEYKIQYTGIGDGAYTMREVLGYIGAMYCGNWAINEELQLTLYPLYQQSPSSMVPSEYDFTSRAKKFDRQGREPGYDCVEVYTSDDVYTRYPQGGNLKHPLVISCPIILKFASKEASEESTSADTIAQDVYNLLNPSSETNYRYRPFSAEGVVFPDFIRLGDEIKFQGNVYCIHTLEIKYGNILTGSMSSPYVEVTEEKYPITAAESKKTARKIAGVNASLSIFDNKIDATIEEVDGIATHFTFESGGPGESGYAQISTNEPNSIKSQFRNDSIKFIDGETELSSWTKDSFSIENLREFRLGDMRVIYHPSNNSVSIVGAGG